ncbi:uncharacterized protein LOC132285639 [Cornus florida]|uniref:uncharacterized protein LOC132285639 n=1 Tax=Cornus florida TaxID=4283 RepID=UPI00289ADA1B|nr:uncharacterized protein LOC132285639 [Cornus florida]
MTCALFIGETVRGLSLLLRHTRFCKSYICPCCTSALFIPSLCQVSFFSHLSLQSFIMSTSSTPERIDIGDSESTPSSSPVRIRAPLPRVSTDRVSSNPLGISPLPAETSTSGSDYVLTHEERKAIIFIRRIKFSIASVMEEFDIPEGVEIAEYPEGADFTSGEGIKESELLLSVGHLNALRFPLHPFYHLVFNKLGLVPLQVNPNFFRILSALLVRRKLEALDLTLADLLLTYNISKHGTEPGRFFFTSPLHQRICTNLPSSEKKWKERMVIVKGKWFVPQSITLPIPRKFGKLGIEYLTSLYTKCSGCFPCQVLMFRRTYEFLGVFLVTFPSSAARNRLSFLEERVWSDPSPIEDLLTSSNLKDIASSAVAVDLMDLSLQSFDSFPITEEEIRRAEALKKKAEDAQPLVVIRSTEDEVEVEEPPIKKSRLNPPSSGKGKVPSKSRGKKAGEAEPEDEVRAFVLAETGAPWTPSFSRVDKSVLHSGDSVITDPSAALAVARGMWLPKDEEAISQMGLEQLLPSAPVRAIEVRIAPSELCYSYLLMFPFMLIFVPLLYKVYTTPWPSAPLLKPNPSPSRSWKRILTRQRREPPLPLPI